jgi:hypothetical protein
MRIGSLAFATCVLAGCALGQGTTTGSSTVTRDYAFPPVGLAGPETAQVNLVNIAPASTTSGAPAPACTGTVTFANASGKTIGTPASFTTTGSQVTSMQLTFSQLDASGTRGEFLASVQLTTAFRQAALCSLVFSLETFDSSSGVTHVYLGNSSTGTALTALPIGIRGPIPN